MIIRHSADGRTVPEVVRVDLMNLMVGLAAALTVVSAVGGPGSAEHHKAPDLVAVCHVNRPHWVSGTIQNRSRHVSPWISGYAVTVYGRGYRHRFASSGQAWKLGAWQTLAILPVHARKPVRRCVIRLSR